jgi:RNA polymerase sigma-70 factor (ECF subfamily)
VSQLEYAEIAAQLNLPLGTVKSRIHEARKQVRRTLGESYT